MKGTNDLILCQAAITEAIQYWINNTFRDPPIVDSVKFYNESFIIQLSEKGPQDALVQGTLSPRSL